MNTRQRISVVLAAITIGVAWFGVSQATAAPEWAAAAEAMAAEDKKQAQITITPMRPPAPSSIGDDLIYDFVGPNTQPAVHTKGP